MGPTGRRLVIDIYILSARWQWKITWARLAAIHPRQIPKKSPVPLI